MGARSSLKLRIGTRYFFLKKDWRERLPLPLVSRFNFMRGNKSVKPRGVAKPFSFLTDSGGRLTHVHEAVAAGFPPGSLQPPHLYGSPETGT